MLQYVSWCWNTKPCIQTIINSKKQAPMTKQFGKEEVTYNLLISAKENQMQFLE